MSKILYEDESYIIRGACFDIYKEFRNRHKEKIYNVALFRCLKRQGLKVEREKQIPIHFQGEKVGVYIPDIVIGNRILIELKCKPCITKEDISQFWYYIKVTGFRLGFLVNFGSENGVEIIRRIYGSE
ncbi:MAG: hypothetical protein COV91_04690 [Candidatus Taylorbacteria bacterium CG11_big_fil_rev_8_21_14_0_20_46_11]|uniref:GxxExxY protein n=1 Tax=Candidatus Taylorbacteria bacterium CG11_big_fil_rev_8_21_14_0_20_46_11 TaxID=1975025 RepID=A0A2H0KD67_9BACT|nr:MAG: hypothetical protein COV91_04690 [Candidatus Taylorbacteria bacterium CG11_big_fil_rev_8_21_14_0_20_46_11]